MASSYSFKKYISVVVICILLFIILQLSISYSAEKEKLEKVNMYLYELEVKGPLSVVSYFLGIRAVESVSWDDEVFREDLQSHFRNIDEGLTNIDYYDPQIVPDSLLIQIHQLQEKVRQISINLIRDKPLDEQTQVDIMNLSEAVFVCEISEVTESWGQVESNLKCLNETIGKAQ